MGVSADDMGLLKRKDGGLTGRCQSSKSAHQSARRPDSTPGWFTESYSSHRKVGPMDVDRRSLLVATFLTAAIAGCGKSENGPAVTSPTAAPGHAPDPNETFVLPYDKITFQAWGNLPRQSGEMATLYGDLNRPGPYLVMMRWNPGWFSAPHAYATDRICVVVSGTWWVNSGNDFLPADAVPVGPGGYVKRTARTPHYDGVPRGQRDPAVIAIFGLGPVDLQLVDPTKPSWRQV